MRCLAQHSHTERQQLAKAISMITVCQAHLPQAFRALSTGPSSSFFIGDLNKWGCQLSEQQLEETGLLWIQGWITSVYNGFFSHIIHIKKKKLLIKMGCFSWNQMLSEVWGYPGKRVREGKSGYLQHHQKCCLEKEMTIHSSILAWRIPQTEEPGGFMSLKVRHDSVSKQQLY